jgi:AraC-like DNA-binding protein
VSQGKPTRPFWQRYDIHRIEDLGNAVLGAELEAVQMAGPRAGGSLAFAAGDGVIFSTGLIRGRISVRGVLSRDAITLAVGLKFGSGSRLWLNPVTDGDVGIFLPGEPCDALLTEGSLYLAANLSQKRLEKAAASEGLILDRRSISRTGLHPRPIVRPALTRLRSAVARIHRQASACDDSIGRAVLRTVVEHYARPPIEGAGRSDPVGQGRIVHKAQEFIRANLAKPISLDAVAAATGTSRRTLARVFGEVIEDTPANYIRRLRLHRIRRDLLCDGTSGCTIYDIAAAWGIGEPGRMAGWYRNMFGEYPNETIGIHSSRHRYEAAI